MLKLILVSVALAPLVLALLASRDTNARRGLSRVVVGVLAYNALYAVLLRYVVPHLG
jgi:hypothetical protein